MLTNMTSSHRLALLVLVLVVLSISISMLVSGTTALLVAVMLCVVIWLIRPWMMPPGYGAMKVRTLTIIGAFGIAASHNFWAEVVNQAAKVALSYPIVQKKASWLTDLHLESEASIMLLVFLGFCVWVVFHYLADKSIAGDHPETLSKDFPEPSFADDLQEFCNALQLHLVGIDKQSNWSPEYYTELEAEVEVTAANGKPISRRIVNLQTALRNDRDTQSFLILGDPGAGKSVALRKLAKDMLTEVPKTGRVPIYINLREWLPTGGRQQAGWTEQSTPTVAQLEEFVISNLKGRGDAFTEAFLEKYFRKLSQHGRLFFIFDSFDEIPELLDVTEESWLIESLSTVFTRFICSNTAGRGVVASRAFRRPTANYQAQKTLDIRPMSDERIIQAMGRYPGFNARLRRELFTDRNDLVPIVRNPFLMALLGEWIDDFSTLPVTQAEMYSHYLRKRLGKCQDKLKKHHLSIDDVLIGATDIALFVFHSPAYGLEAPVELIGDETQIPSATAIIGILRHARIARVTEGDIPSFAFVHRRFLEYLVTTRLLTQPELVPREHIPTDSRGRDAMVLYAQLCDLPTAEALAVHCWSEVRTNFEDTETRLRAIHCLRFLTDAYTSRRPAVAGFADELAAFIASHVGQGGNLLYAKICLEATGLLSEDQAVPILQLALDGNNSWLQETAFRACRRLPRLKPVLQRAIEEYLIHMPIQQFWYHRNSLLLSLSLSEATAGPYRVARLRIYNLIASIVAALPVICMLPKISLSIGAWWLIVYFASPVILRDSRRSLTSAFRTPEMSAVITIATSDHLLQPIRIMLAFFTGVIGFQIVITNQLPAIKPKDISWILPLLPAHTVAIGIATLLFAAMLMDWYCAAAIGRLLAKLRIVARAFLKSLSYIFFAVLLWWSIEWLLNSQLKWILFAVLSLFSAMSVTFFIYRAVQFALFCYRDYQVYKMIKIGTRMSRADIAQALNSLQWLRLRLAVVQKLAQQKTAAHGDWPPEFALSISGGQAITELAKLEERWLKLDR